MEPTIQFTGGELAIVRAKRKAAPVAHIPDPDLSVPERGTTGPVPIGDVMDPLRRIIAHPDRNRLLAEFCKRYF